MFDVSVEEILKTKGEWIQSSDFEDLVAKFRKVSQRQARNLIKRALEDKKKPIKKVTFPDRTVWYGLREWGIPKEITRNNEVSDFQSTLIPQFWKERREAQKLWEEGRLSKAYAKTVQFIDTLPPATKEKFSPIIVGIENELEKIDNKRIWRSRAYLDGMHAQELPLVQVPASMSKRIKEMRARLSRIIPEFWEQIADILHQP